MHLNLYLYIKSNKVNKHNFNWTYYNKVLYYNTSIY